MRRYCRGRGKNPLACFNVSDVADILSVGGDILAYCSLWAQPFYHSCATPQPKAVTGEKLGPSSSFWPWVVFSSNDVMLDRHLRGSRSTISGHVPVMLSRGDGAQGEPELLACTRQPSFVLLAWARLHVEAVRMCTLGCGQALKDGGSGICIHADEVPCIFASWLSDRFFLRVRLWRSCHKDVKTDIKHDVILRARCATLKCVTLVVPFQQRENTLKPIDFVRWAEKHSMPHVFEPKRPSKSDPHDVIMLSSWVFQYARPRGTSIASVTFFKQQAVPQRRLVSRAALSSSPSTATK